jgi:transposase
LRPAAEPDRTEVVSSPVRCRGCGEGLADAADAGMGWAQVWDILALTLEKVHYLLPRRRCGCGKTTTAAPPFGAAGNVTYGPNVNAAAILLASQGNVPIERTAQLMEALLGVPVSRGFGGRRRWGFGGFWLGPPRATRQPAQTSAGHPGHAGPVRQKVDQVIGKRHARQSCL